jgi:predicted MFS family arabinose efflux permease
MGAQILLASNKAVLFLLVISGQIEFWHLAVTGLINGCAVGFSLPGRLSFVAEVVPEEKFTQAYGLYYVALNTMRIGGPAVGGIVIAVSGAEGAYAIITVAQTLALVFLFFVHGRQAAPPKATTPFWKDMGSIFTLAISSPTILILMGAHLGITFFVSSSTALLPVFAKEVYGLGASGLGQFQAAIGIGGLLGALIIASLGNLERKALLLLLAGTVQGLVLMLFASMSVFYLGLIVLVSVGFAQAVYTTINSTLFQQSPPPDMRGRAMSLYMLGNALQPLGVLPVSSAADSFGVQSTVAVAASLLIVYMALVAVAFPRFRSLRS